MFLQKDFFNLFFPFGLNDFRKTETSKKAIMVATPKNGGNTQD
jgi:hypothetical protein